MCSPSAGSPSRTRISPVAIATSTARLQDTRALGLPHGRQQVDRHATDPITVPARPPAAIATCQGGPVQPTTSTDDREHRVSTGDAAEHRRRPPARGRGARALPRPAATATWPTTSRPWPRPTRTLFGICVVGVAGRVVRGRRRRPRRSRSRASPSRSSSPWCARRSATRARAQQLGVNGTGLPFNSVMAVELQRRPHHEPDGQRGRHRDHEPRPGRHGRGEVGRRARRAVPVRRARLELDEERLRLGVGDQPAQPGHRAPARELRPSYFDPDEATDVYTRQCSLRVTAHDLAVMGATLADGGVNPMTGERVVAAGACRARARRAGHRRALRALRRLALRRRPARQERRERRHRHRGARQGRRSATSRRRSTTPATACAASSSTRYLSDALGLNLFASVPRPAADRAGRARPGWAMSFFDALGWAGAVMILGAYGLLTLGRWDAASLRYQVTNTIGAVALLACGVSIAAWRSAADQRGMGAGRDRRAAPHLGAQPAARAAAARGRLTPAYADAQRRPGCGTVPTWPVRGAPQRRGRATLGAGAGSGASVRCRTRSATDALAWLWERSIVAVPRPFCNRLQGRNLPKRLAYAPDTGQDAKRLQAPGISHPDLNRLEGDSMSVPVRRRTAAVIGGVAAALLLAACGSSSDSSSASGSPAASNTDPACADYAAYGSTPAPRSRSSPPILPPEQQRSRTAWKPFESAPASRSCTKAATSSRPSSRRASPVATPPTSR